MKKLFIILFFVSVTACTSAQYKNQVPLNQAFPAVQGESLEGNLITIPKDFLGAPSLLILGYKQDSQFDIDRWLIGLDMTKTEVAAYELPTIRGLAPRMFKNQINQGMRNGIPEFLWGGVITIFKHGDLVQRFTGNQSPNNARIVLLDKEGLIRFFYDRGFSVDALNQLRATLASLGQDEI